MSSTAETVKVVDWRQQRHEMCIKYASYDDAPKSIQGIMDFQTNVLINRLEELPGCYEMSFDDDYPGAQVCITSGSMGDAKAPQIWLDIRCVSYENLSFLGGAFTITRMTDSYDPLPEAPEKLAEYIDSQTDMYPADTIFNIVATFCDFLKA